MYITEKIIKLKNNDIFIKETKNQPLVTARILKFRELYSLFSCDHVLQNR